MPPRLGSLVLVLYRLRPRNQVLGNPLASSALPTRTARLLLCIFPVPEKRVRKSSGPRRGWDRDEWRHEIPSPLLCSFATWRALLRATHELPQASEPTAPPCDLPNLRLPNSRGSRPNK